MNILLSEEAEIQYYMDKAMAIYYYRNNKLDKAIECIVNCIKHK